MSKVHGRRRRKGDAGRVPHAIRLADGVHLLTVAASGRTAPLVLVCADGKVQLNGSAASILKLCDGTRDRDSIVAQLVQESQRTSLAREIVEFLEVARARGWIVEE
jgi:coenzyme PQQ biosynthesis protein PqqD